MRYLKKYESYKGKPKVGNFAIVKVADSIIGVINDIDINYNDVYIYVVEYPEDYEFAQNEIVAYEHELLCYSENKEDCEMYLDSKKFNL